jgi:hypothetical protein
MSKDSIHIYFVSIIAGFKHFSYLFVVVASDVTDVFGFTVFILNQELDGILIVFIIGFGF